MNKLAIKIVNTLQLPQQVAILAYKLYLKSYSNIINIKIEKILPVYNI